MQTIRTNSNTRDVLVRSRGETTGTYLSTTLADTIDAESLDGRHIVVTGRIHSATTDGRFVFDVQGGTNVYDGVEVRIDNLNELGGPDVVLFTTADGGDTSGSFSPPSGVRTEELSIQPGRGAVLHFTADAAATNGLAISITEFFINSYVDGATLDAGTLTITLNDGGSIEVPGFLEQTNLSASPGHAAYSRALAGTYTDADRAAAEAQAWDRFGGELIAVRNLNALELVQFRSANNRLDLQYTTDVEIDLTSALGTIDGDPDSAFPYRILARHTLGGQVVTTGTRARVTVLSGLTENAVFAAGDIKEFILDRVSGSGGSSRYTLDLLRPLSTHFILPLARGSNNQTYYGLGYLESQYQLTAWRAQARYLAGAVVNANGSLYIATQHHTSGDDFAADESDYWRQIDIETSQTAQDTDAMRRSFQRHTRNRITGARAITSSSGSLNDILTASFQPNLPGSWDVELTIEGTAADLASGSIPGSDITLTYPDSSTRTLTEPLNIEADGSFSFEYEERNIGFSSAFDTLSVEIHGRTNTLTGTRAVMDRHRPAFGILKSSAFVDGQTIAPQNRPVEPSWRSISLLSEQQYSVDAELYNFISVVPECRVDFLATDGYDSPQICVQNVGASYVTVSPYNDPNEDEWTLVPGESGVWIWVEIGEHWARITDLANDTVLEQHLNAGAVTAAKIAADAVTSAKIPDDAIGAEHIATDAVGSDAIATGAVGTDEIAADAVTGDKIPDDAIDTEHIATDAIRTDHILDGAVTRAKLAADARGVSSPDGGTFSLSATSIRLVLFNPNAVSTPPTFGLSQAADGTLSWNPPLDSNWTETPGNNAVGTIATGNATKSNGVWNVAWTSRLTSAFGVDYSADGITGGLSVTDEWHYLRTRDQHGNWSRWQAIGLGTAQEEILTYWMQLGTTSTEITHSFDSFDPSDYDYIRFDIERQTSDRSQAERSISLRLRSSQIVSVEKIAFGGETAYRTQNPDVEVPMLATDGAFVTLWTGRRTDVGTWYADQVLWSLRLIHAAGSPNRVSFIHLRKVPNQGVIHFRFRIVGEKRVAAD